VYAGPGGASEKQLNLNKLVQQLDERTIQRLLDMGGTGHRRLFMSEEEWKQFAERDLLELAVKAVEERLPHHRGHWTRTVALARTLAQEVGISPKDVPDIAMAASLLDVGMIYEEFSEVTSEEFFGISSKICPPTAQERSLGRALLERTADLARTVISWRGNVEQYIRFSHEWYDGSGYPLGLAADEIPVGARIIAIASSADLLARQYRVRHRSPDDAFDMLRRHSGTSFDPSLVDAFVQSHQVRFLLQSDREA
jgi:HD-GYP domain-containing protein (c-di-GMP phosphodiesterase class II)